MSAVRANAAATSADAIEPGAAMPEPQIRLGTPVARSQAACHVPDATSFCHAAVGGCDHFTWRSTRNGFVILADGIAVSASLAIRRPVCGTTAPAGAVRSSKLLTSTADLRHR